MQAGASKTKRTANHARQSVLKDVSEQVQRIVHQARVRSSVLSQPFRGALDRVLKQRDSVVERMCYSSGRMNPSEAMLFERELSEKWRAESERMNGGTKVVNESGKRQLC